MEKINEKKCDLCSSRNFKVIYKERADKHNELELSLVRCSNCGLMFVNPQPPEEIKGYVHLQDVYDGVLNTQGLYRQEIYSYITKRISEIYHFSASGEYKILDIGCGIGEFIKHCGSLGWEAEGVEPSMGLANFAQKRGLTVIHGYFDAIAGQAYKYNVVTLLDVLEHVNDPLALLKKINTSVQEETLLVIRVPYGPFQVFRAKFFKKVLLRKGVLLGAKDHIYQFSEDTIKKLVEKADFEIIRIEPSVFESTRGNFFFLNMLKRIYLFASFICYITLNKIISNSMIVYARKKHAL